MGYFASDGPTTTSIDVFHKAVSKSLCIHHCTFQFQAKNKILANFKLENFGLKCYDTNNVYADAAARRSMARARVEGWVYRWRDR